MGAKIQLSWKMRQPPAPTSFVAMPIRHVTNEMVADKLAFEGSEQKNIYSII